MTDLLAPRGTTSTSPASADQGLSRRAGYTTDFRIGDLDGTLTTAVLRDTTMAATFDLRVGKHGSTIAGLAEALATAATLAWQHGTPLAEITDAWQQTRFVPNGTTDDPDIPDTTSLADYVARRLLLNHSPADTSTAAIAAHDGPPAR